MKVLGCIPPFGLGFSSKEEGEEVIKSLQIWVKFIKTYNLADQLPQLKEYPVVPVPIPKEYVEKGKFSEPIQETFEDLIDVQGAAKFLNVSLSMVRTLCKRKELPYIKFGSSYRFRKFALLHYLKEQEIKMGWRIYHKL